MPDQTPNDVRAAQHRGEAGEMAHPGEGLAGGTGARLKTGSAAVRG